MILCQKNRRDIEEIDEQYLKGFTVHYVDTVDEVLKLALLNVKVPQPMELTVPEDCK